MAVQAQLRRALQALQEIARISSGTLVVAQVLLYVVSLVVGYLWKLDPPLPNWVMVFVYGLHAALATYTIVATHHVKNFSSIVRLDEIAENISQGDTEREKLDRTNKSQDAQIAVLFNRSASVLGALSVLQGFLQDEQTKEAKPEHVESLLAPLIRLRSEALGFTADDMHNFVVYVPEGPQGDLSIFYRKCDDRIERTDRVWKRGHGHVGLAFIQRKTIISSDLAAMKELLDEGLPSDSKFYASYISAPIFDRQAEDPIGVLVMTSSRSGHFTQEHKMLAESYAVILSTYLSSTGKRGTSHEQEQSKPGH
jgi:GAF domain-containing protein